MNSLRNILNATLVLATITFFSCHSSNESQSTEIKDTELTVIIRDIKGQSIVYDLYWSEGDQREYISSHISEPNGLTVVNIKKTNDADAIVVVRKRLKTQSERRVELSGDTLNIHFLL